MPRNAAAMEAIAGAIVFPAALTYIALVMIAMRGARVRLRSPL